MVSSVGTITTDAKGNNYKVVLSDDFSAGYKYSNWGSVYHGGVYGNGAFWWNANDVKVASGEMQVSVTRQANGSWSAGGFNSKAAGVTIKYGTVEFDARVETAQGTQAAILMWPKSDVWPRDGEIDILETPKGTAMHTVHWAGANNKDTYSGKFSGIDTSQTHHYKMTWLPNLLTVEVDGKLAASWTNPDMIPDTAMGFGAMGYVADNSQAWLGGGPTSKTPSKVITHIDNVVMSQWTGTASTGGNSGGSSPSNPAPVTPKPVATTIGSGNDALVLKISQDAYNGNAQYIVSVDGKQVGGTLSVGALHSTGKSDIITIKGDWGAGDHKLTVKFINDASGSGGDRNLYIDDLTYKGATFAKDSHSFSVNGPNDFRFSESTEGFGATYLGTANKDSFAIGRGDGHVVIDHFTSGIDKLQFSGLAQSGLHTAATTEGGISGMLVSFDQSSDTVFLAHVSKLAASDMLFA